MCFAIKFGLGLILVCNSAFIYAYTNASKSHGDGCLWLFNLLEENHLDPSKIGGFTFFLVMHHTDAAGSAGKWG